MQEVHHNVQTACPELTSFELMKKQFDWLIGGEVFHLIQENLGLELAYLEYYLR
jgi:hypothetical protein